MKEIFWTRVGNDCLSKKLKILVSGLENLFQKGKRNYFYAASTSCFKWRLSMNDLIVHLLLQMM